MANLRANNLTGTGGRNAITGAVYFGGDNDTGGLTIADTTDLELGSETNWTIEFWIKLNHSALSDWDVIMGKGSNQNGGTEYEWFVEVMSGDHLVFLSTTAGTAWDFNQQITPALVVGEWYHIAIVRNGSGANTLKSYVNGVQYSTHTSQNIYTGNDTFGIGHFAHTNGLNSDVTLSNARVVKGTSVYTAAFTPPTSKLTAIPNTVLLCCQDSADATQEATGKTITVVGNAKATKDTPPVGVDEGVVFDGDTKVNTQSYMYFPTGDTSQRGRGRGLFAGAGPSFSKEINYIQIQSQGNTTKFGDLTTALADVQGGSSSTRGLFGAGGGSGSPGFVNTIEYVTIATTANATDFGDLNETTFQGAALANDTRYVYGGGTTPTVKDVIDYVTIGSAGNATDFGNLTEARFALTGFSSPTRGIFAGGASPTIVNTIDYITIASAGNATDFGDVTSEDTRNPMAASSSTRGVIAGGQTPAPSTGTNAIDFLTIATTGSTTDFGDLTDGRRRGSGLSNSIRGVFAGGYDPSAKNTMDYITIASTGNANDFGDYSGASIARLGTGASDSHGGL